MATKGISLLDDTFPAAASSGIVAQRVAVLDPTNHGNIKLPAATPEHTAIGAFTETVSNANNVGVQLAGVAILQSDGSAVINPGDYLIGVGTTGEVKTQALAVPAAPGTQSNWNTYNIIGMCVDTAQIPATAGAAVSVLLMPFIIFAA